MSSITNYTQIDYIKILSSKNKFDAIEELVSTFEGASFCNDIKQLKKSFVERESIMSTGIGLGIAIPHVKIAGITDMTFAVGISKEGIDFDSMDNKPVFLIILVAAGESQHKHYLKLLSNIMSILKDNEIKEKIINSDSPEEIMDILSQ